MNKDNKLAIAGLKGRLQQFVKMSCIYRARSGDVCLKDTPIAEMLDAIDTLQIDLEDAEKEVARVNQIYKSNLGVLAGWKQRAEEAEAKLEPEAVQ